MVNFLPKFMTKETIAILSLKNFRKLIAINQWLPSIEFIFHNSYVTLEFAVPLFATFDIYLYSLRSMG
jgi:hypothetical protein